MATTLLYHRDALLLAFDARVTSLRPLENSRVEVVLDETAFYPEAGGQMADRGMLAGHAVVDVQVDDAGVVRHVLESSTALTDGAVPSSLQPGASVRGEIDRARRRQFMALHTAQHMLSRALIDVAKAETVSARLGESVCTVDVDVPALGESALAKAEALTNSVVDDDVVIRAWFPSNDELASLPLRRKPKVDDNIRVVSIGEVATAFDVSPCGGTHCTHSAQVGLVRVVGLEKYKGMTRVSFQAGPRARTEVFDRARLLETLAREFSSSPSDVAQHIDKLKAQIKTARDDRSLLVDRLASLLAPGVSGPTVVDGDVELLRSLAARLVASGQDALLACNTGEGVHVLFARSSSSSLDCGALLRRVAAAAGGKGGGKPERAEGRLPANVDVLAMIAAAQRQ